ncbi:hypothetical protein [Nitrospira sp. Nam74]
MGSLVIGFLFLRRLITWGGGPFFIGMYYMQARSLLKGFFAPSGS